MLSCVTVTSHKKAESQENRQKQSEDSFEIQVFSFLKTKSAATEDSFKIVAEVRLLHKEGRRVAVLSHSLKGLLINNDRLRMENHDF